ncbi:hypothetical protein PTI98_013250 [Pleurotus ostreatus]|nr:hypothetical protein PTI98_013250 [Pleurotus ostreatus]
MWYQHILGSLVLPKRVKILLDLALLSGVVDDAIIAGSIVLSLFKARTGFRK